MYVDVTNIKSLERYGSIDVSLPLKNTTLPAMKIIFMGTPDFAVPSLQIVLENGYEIAAVVTAPDKPGGRQGIQQSAVKKFAAEKGLFVLQPSNLKSEDFLAKLRAFDADLFIVVAFRMLPKAVWSMPPMGTMNLHGSLLPKYRGAAPINWAIIRGERETGVTTFLIRHEIDTGDLLFQEKIPIGADETAGALHDKMMEIGAQLLLRSVRALEDGTARPTPQADIEATHAPKIHAETCKINFAQSSATVHNFIRGLSPYPGAWTTLQGKVLKILQSRIVSTPISPDHPGMLVVEGHIELKISTNDGYIQVLALQLEGKKRMETPDFLRGNPIKASFIG